MVGDLYQEGDNRRDGAFTIFYMGINLGALLGGLISGAAVDSFGWKAGFLAAGIGMVISLIMQMTMAQSWLGNIGSVPAAARAKELNKSKEKAPLTKEEFDRLKVILIMGLFVIVFWAGFEQAGGATSNSKNMVDISSAELLPAIFVVFFAPSAALGTAELTCIKLLS